MANGGNAAKAMQKILVVGGGLTAGVSSCQLSKQLGRSSVTVWDKARGAGGRMSTSRSNGNPECKVDLGVQYISATKAYREKHNSHYSELLAAGTFQPLDSSLISGIKDGDFSEHFVTPSGVSSVVKHYFKDCQDVQFGKHVERVDLNADQSGWKIKTKTGDTADFDAVVLTMPAPQILGLAGSVADLISARPDIKSGLESVGYSSRYALGLFWDEPAVNLRMGAGKVAEYISDDPVFRFVSVDNLKRGLPASSSPTSAVLHTCVPFGVEHVEKTPEEVKPILMAELKRKFPEWPEPKQVKCQKWRYSQVSQSYPGQPGCVVLSEKPLLILGGDGFTHSNFDGCIESAEAIVAAATAQK